jgi:predicted site-specific integrase-resolvase
MSRFIKIGKTAEILGVSIQTLRRWELLGSLLPDRKSEGGTRYYDLDKLLGFKKTDNDLTIAYARVSSHDQDVLEIITVFSARLYGARSHKNKKLLEAAKALISE